MRKLHGLKHLRIARGFLESANRSVHERLLQAANAYWQAMLHYDAWPPELQAATEEIHACILTEGRIPRSVATMTDEQAEAASERLLQFIAKAEAIAAGID